MKDLSMHILDIAENSVRAGAKRTLIEIEEDSRAGVISISIADDGRGMSEEEIRCATDPFYTSKAGKHVGLGLPLLKEKAGQCGGTFEVTSVPGEGTAVCVTMDTKNIDCPPLGDINATLASLIAGNPDVIFEVVYAVDGVEERFSTEDAQAAGSSGTQ